MQTEFRYSTVFNLFSNQAERFPDREYLIKSVRYTYKQSLKMIRQLSAELLKLNPDRCAVVISLNCALESVLCFWSCMLAGMDIIFMPLAPASVIEGIPETLKNEVFRIYDFNLQFGACLQNEPEEDVSYNIIDIQPDVYFFSSGTTGTAKLIKNTSYQIINALSYMVNNNNPCYLTGCHCVYLTMPVYHSYGLSSLMEYTALAATIVLPAESGSIGPVKGLFNNQVTGQIDSVEGVPHFYAQVQKMIPRLDLPALKHIGFGSDFINQELINSFHEKFPDVSYSIRYGITEIPSMLGINEFKYHPQLKLDSLPSIFPIYAAYVDNEPISSFERIGELSVDAAIGENEKKKFKTGDMVRITEEGSSLVGRSSSFFKYRGFKVNPVVIERQIDQFPMIISSKVFLNGKNRLTAEIHTSGNVGILELRQYLSDRLPYYMVPDLFQEVEEIKRTITGKIVRYASKN